MRCHLRTLLFALSPLFAAAAALPTALAPPVLPEVYTRAPLYAIDSIPPKDPVAPVVAQPPISLAEEEQGQAQVQAPSHLVAVPCQGCNDGSDAFVFLEFQSLSSPESLCDQAKFRLQDDVVTLSVSDAFGDLTYVHDQWSILIGASCSSIDHYQRQTVTLTLDSQAGQPLKERAGFSITVDPSQPVSVSDITIFKDIGGLGSGQGQSTENASLATPYYKDNQVFTRVKYVLTQQQTPLQAAKSLLTAVDLVQDQLRQQNILVQQSQESCRRSIRHRVVCSAKAICQRTCDAFHSLIDKIKLFIGEDTLKDINDNFVQVMAKMRGHAGCDQDLDAAAKNASMEKPINATLTTIEPEHNDNALVRVLEIIAGAIGLTALFALIRRRFTSLRRKVERLADREERRTVREYRRAARREALRKKWRGFRGLFICGSDSTSDYEEKRALILAAAEEGLAPDYTELDPDMVEADMNGLRYAHEIVVAMVRARDGVEPLTASSSTTLLAPDARSRSSTLPSYESEKLPDYSSQPESDNGSVTNGFRNYAPSVGSSSAQTAATPESSVPELSPRPSRETLRTGTIGD